MTYLITDMDNLIKHIYELIDQYRGSREHAEKYKQLDYKISYQGSILSLYRLLADITGESVQDLMKENNDW